MPHTPGPWSLSGAQIIGGLREDGTTYHRICEMVTHSMEDAETIRANADLICASPDLLAACIALYARWDNTPYARGSEYTDDEALDMALAAIAKAEGEEKEECVTESRSSDAA